MKKENFLTVSILLALVLGALFGQLFLYDATKTAEALRQAAAPYQAAGDLIFIRPLMMLIVPLVFASVVTGVTAIGNPAKLGVVGGATMLYFLATTTIAVLLGMALVNMIGPGVGVSPELFANAQKDYQEQIATRVESGPTGVGAAFFTLLRDMIPTNVVRAAADGNILGVVVFAILLGVALAVVGAPAGAFVDALEAFLAALMKIVGWIMWLAPIGVFLIIAARVGAAGLANLVGPLGLYVLTVVLGLAIHGLIVLPLVLWVFGKTNPYDFMWRVRRIALTAFSTASSSATLPVTIETCSTVGGCSKRASTFVAALGSTINMNGTALYEAVAVIFLFQIFGYELTLTEQIVVLVTATLAAIGAPGIPAAGIVTMAIVINAVNTTFLSRPDTPDPLPLWTIAIIYGVDRFLDMCRTTINVMGDAVGAKLMSRLAPDDDTALERAIS